MILVNKYKNEFGNQIKLIFSNGQTLYILFAGNQDLYIIHRENTSSDSCEFEITEDDYELYCIFDKLYTNIVEYKPYDNKVDNIFKESEKYKQYPLVKNDEIYFYSDDDPEEIASLLKISKNDGIISLYLKYGTHLEGMKSNGIRIRTNGSRYGLFYIPFMQMYNEINETNFEYHQVTIEEYMKKLK